MLPGSRLEFSCNVIHKTEWLYWKVIYLTFYWLRRHIWTWMGKGIPARAAKVMIWWIAITAIWTAHGIGCVLCFLRHVLRLWRLHADRPLTAFRPVQPNAQNKFIELDCKRLQYQFYCNHHLYAQRLQLQFKYTAPAPLPFCPHWVKGEWVRSCHSRMPTDKLIGAPVFDNLWMVIDGESQTLSQHCHTHITGLVTPHMYLLRDKKSWGENVYFAWKRNQALWPANCRQ